MSALARLRPVIALYWAGDRRMLIYGVVLSLITALMGIGLLGLSGWFITATAIAGTSTATALAFDVFMPSAGIRLLALGRTGARYGERIVTHDAMLRVLASLRERLFRQLALSEQALTLTARPARLLFRLTIDIDALDSLYLRGIVPLLTAAAAALAVTGALALGNPLLALLVLAVFLTAGLGLPIAASFRAAPWARRRAHALETLRSRAIDLVKGQTDLLMTNRLGAQVASVQSADTRLAKADRALSRIEADIGFGFGIAGAGLLASILIAVAYLAEAGLFGAPAGAFAILLGLASLEPFAPLRRGAVEFGRTILAAKRLGPGLAGKPPSPHRDLTAPRNAAVVIENAIVRHPGATAPVLSGISFGVRSKERIAIVGASGAGKSTVLALIAGEIQPVQGRIEALSVGVLSQRTELFSDTVRGNLALANPQANDGLMLEALHSAGLGEVIASLPHGLDTMLGEGGAGFSAGQARRLALARLFLRDSPVWLLDEPTEGLDADTARDVLRRLVERAHGRSLVIATHTLREAELAERIILLDGGRLTADWSREDPQFAALADRLRAD